MADSDKGKSLQQVLRERREARPLLTAAQLRRRELEREREALESTALAAVESWRETGKAVDVAGRLPVPVYRAIFELDPAAYRGSKHWARRLRAQREAAPACEVTRCGEPAGILSFLLDRTAVGEEQPLRDLITLCADCERRVLRLERELGRLPRRPEIARLDPKQPLYDAARIAVLRTRYARPPRRKDLGA